MEKVYIRFSEDIYADIERGHSTYFRTKEKMDGLCAWTTPFYTVGSEIRNDRDEVASDSELLDYAKRILNNTYGSYSDNSIANIITGTYVDSGNDGVLLQDVELISTIEL